MSHKKYVLFDLDDEKLSLLTDVLSNKTSKKILDYLAENEASETQIARALNLPANTVHYNTKKLLQTGLIESTKEWFWSVKGKKVLKYKVANKKIIISPKTKNNTKSILSSIFLVGLGAFIVKIVSDKYFTKANIQNTVLDNEISLKAAEIAPQVMDEASNNLSQMAGFAQDVTMESSRGIINSGIASGNYFWLSFLVGGLFAIVSFIVLSRFFEKQQ